MIDRRDFTPYLTTLPYTYTLEEISLGYSDACAFQDIAPYYIVGTISHLLFVGDVANKSCKKK